MTTQRSLLLSFLLLLGSGNPADSQVDLANVTGVVEDSQGLAIPGAQIVARNLGTGIETAVESNESGYFALVSLNPGDYELAVQAEGFKRYVHDDIQLETGKQVRLDVVLQIGVVTESVTVTSGAPVINLENGATKGDVILYEELQDLPVEGRDFTELAYLIPGVLPRGRGAGSFASVNGARGDQTNFYVDGVSNRNPVGGGAQVRPPLDAVEEFRVETSGFSAEYGGYAGGIVGITMRSGKNQVHGSLFEYKRHEFMDARRKFDREKTRRRRDQFGGTLSGPIVKNRNFFLVSYEGRYNSVQQTRYGRVPTVAERVGDFSNSVHIWGNRRDAEGNLLPVYLNDPNRAGQCSAETQQGCFPNMTIPLGRQEPAALHLLNLYPLPSEIQDARRALNERLNQHNIVQDDDYWHQMVAKFDQYFSAKDRFSASYQKRFNNLEAPFAGSPLAFWGNFTRNRRSLLSARHTHTFSPNLVLEFAAGYSQRDNYVNSIGADDDPASFGLALPEDLDPRLTGLPRVTVAGFWPLGQASGTPNEQEVMDLQFTSRLSWVKGSHKVKLGINYNRIYYNQPVWANARGTLVFNRRFTKHSVGDLLLGQLTSSTRRVSTTYSSLRAYGFGMFLSDDWKVNRKLTLNLGIRYEFEMPPVDLNDRLSTYEPGLNKVVIAGDQDLPDLIPLLEEQGLAGRTVLARDVGMTRRLIDPDINNFAPRLGFAWRPFGGNRHVLRGGYGVFYGGTLLGPVRNQLAGGFPFTFVQSFRSQGMRGEPLPTITNPYPSGRKRTQGPGTNNVNAFDPDPPSSYLQRWNMTVERDMGGGQVVEIGYVGSKGTKLQRKHNINLQIRDPALAEIGANGNYIFPRPIQDFNNINYNSFGANSSFHSLQASLRRRSRSGFFYRVNYTFGKSLDEASTHTDDRVGTGGALDNFNLKLDRGRSNFDQRHVFTVATRYPLPLGKGRHFLPNLKGPAQAILGGWQLASTIRAYSGQPFTVLSANVDLNAGESRRPNRIGDGYLDPHSQPGQKGVDFPWFDLDAFERVPCYGTENNNGIECTQSTHGFKPWHPGNSGRNILDMPGQFRVNLSLQKNFRFENRRRLQIRLDAFNAPNMKQLGNVSAAAAQFDGAQGGLIANSRGARTMQASLSYQF